LIVLTGASGGIGQAILPKLKELDVTIGTWSNHYMDGGGVRLNLDKNNTSLPEEIYGIKPFVEFYEKDLTHITLIHLAAVKIDELAVFVDEGNWDKVFNVNVKGAFFLSQALLPIMIKEKFGRIIWILSSGLGDIGTTTYSTTKYALIGLSEVLSREYAKYGITSNILQLGFFATGMWEKLSQVKKEELLNQIPSKELCDPKAIVDMIKVIIENKTLNGGVYNLDGGV
jgi:3-oxoacyl-[acyl-carrier protein] reductase